MKKIFFGLSGTILLTAVALATVASSAIKGDKLLFLASQSNCLVAATAFVEHPEIGGAYITELSKTEYLKDNKPDGPHLKKYINNRYDDNKPFKSILITAVKGSSVIYCTYVTSINSVELKEISTPRKVYSNYSSIAIFGVKHVLNGVFKTRITEDEFDLMAKIKFEGVANSV